MNTMEQAAVWRRAAQRLEQGARAAKAVDPNARSSATSMIAMISTFATIMAEEWEKEHRIKPE